MLIVVDPHSGVPVYRQVVNQVRFQIASGLMKPGDELPSTRALSLRLAVNPMTISKAYGILEDEGIVTRRPGLPLMVKGHAPGKHAAARLEQLALALRPATLAAVQLGVTGEKAGELFRTLVEKSITSVESSE